MVTDIHPMIMGPHQLASIDSRAHALAAYGIDPHALVAVEERSLAEIANRERALAVSTDHDITVVNESHL